MFMNKIYYFSATGNSKFVALGIQREFGGELINIGSALKNEELKYDAKDGERVFFIFPVYFFGLPKAVERFIERSTISHGENLEVIGICTNGGQPGGSKGGLKKALKAKGIDLAAYYSIRMVDNYIPMFKIPLREEQIMINRRAEKELREVMDSIKFSNRLTHQESPIWKVLSPITRAVYDFSRKTGKFYATDSCIGCKICAKNCPDEAIKIVDGKPLWTKEKCTFCMGCIHNCPVESIEYGKGSIGKVRYNNPLLED